MKLLCVTCDEPMKLVGSEGPVEGSITITFVCPRCDHRIALLTHPGETQLVHSLGVQIGGRPGAPLPLELVRSTLAHQASQLSPAAEPSQKEDGPVWTEAALERLEKVPTVVKPMAKKAVERFARLRGCRQITEEVVERATIEWGDSGHLPL